MKHLLLCFLLLSFTVLAQTTPTPPTPQAQAPRKPLTVYRIQAGDLDGDGKSEILAWDSETKELSVSAYDKNGTLKRLTAHKLENFPGQLRVADLDGDRRAEVVIGEGLRGYNPKTGPQTDVQVRIYRPLDKDGWTPQEIYRQASERPDVTALEITDLDGDRIPEIVFSYYAEKYQVDYRIARRQGAGWKIETLPRVRMGSSMAVGAPLPDRRKHFVIGRPYGEDIGALGDAFVLKGESRELLPVFRGVSSLALGDLDGDRQAEIVAGDGWHQDFGKIARARLAVLKRVGASWDYKLIEDLPEHTRIRTLLLVDLDRDGRAEIIAHGERKSSLGGDVRVYQRTATGWRGLTAAQNVQGFALGSFRRRGQLELLFAGAEPQLFTLDLRAAKWDAALAKEVETYKIDPATLLAKTAPRLQAEEWLGSAPLALDQLKGKVVLLDFWATWCKPCIAQFPAMRAWQEKYGPQGLVIIGITNHSSQTAAEIRAFYTQHKLPWPVAIDARDRAQMDYGVSPIPHTFLIDRQGAVRLSHVGGGKLEDIEKQIKNLLGPAQ